MKNINPIIEYYSDKIIKHGTTPLGVDWNGEESQYLRFKILSNIIESKKEFSLLDFGCGYGEYFNYLNSFYTDFKYFGFDLSKEMIIQAKKLNNKGEWLNSLPNDFKIDYTILSGIFNIKLDISETEWEKYIFNTLKYINAISVKGFSFNMLTSYSDKEYMKNNLYYASPEKIFTFCKTNFSKYICLDHSYPLYEFSIFVKK